MFDSTDIITALALGLLAGAVSGIVAMLVCGGKTADRRSASDYRRLARTQRELADARAHAGTPYRFETTAAADALVRHERSLASLGWALAMLDNDDHSKRAELRRRPATPLTLVEPTTTEGVTA